MELGDKVRVKSLDELKKSCNRVLDNGNSFDFGTAFFLEKMREFCGVTAKIIERDYDEDCDGNGVISYELELASGEDSDISSYVFTDKMLVKVEEEKKIVVKDNSHYILVGKELVKLNQSQYELFDFLKYHECLSGVVEIDTNNAIDLS